MAWHARKSLTGGRRDGSKLTQVRHGRGRGVGWVQSRGEQLVRSGHVVVCRVVQHARGVLNCTPGACNFTSFGRVTPCTPRILGA